MPFINWRVATAEDLATLNVQMIKTELQRRSFSTTGNKEELIDRLLVDTAQEPPPNVPAASTSFPTVPAPTMSFPEMPTFTSDPAENMQRMTAFLHQNMAVMMTTIASQANPVHLTTLPDLSASLPTFNGSGTPTLKHWVEELERTQRLARWEDPTLLAIAQGKLRGVAADWHVSTGRQLTTWTIWKAGLEEQFGEQLSLIQWHQRVAAITQKAGESLQQYAFAKLKRMSRCPVHIADKERIEYLVQGIRDEQVATSIAVQRPRTVDDFLSIVSEVDRALDHTRLARSSKSTEQALGRPTPQGTTAKSDSAVNSPQSVRSSTFQHTTRVMPPPRITSLPPPDQESRYEAISTKYGAPAYRRGQDLKDAVCYNCQKKGHLASKCTEPKQPVRDKQTVPKAPTACVGRAEDFLSGSKFRCAVVTAQVKGLGEISAFPDSGSNVTILAASLASNLKLEPWTKPPLLVVGGSSVMPEGSVFLRITIGPLSAVVEAAVLERNALPLILGEDWFYTAQAELHFKPPLLPVICQPSNNIIVQCKEELLPRMSNAVILTTSALSRFDPPHSTAEPLQVEHEPDENEPLWSQPNKATLAQVDTTRSTSHLETGPPRPLPPDQPAIILDDNVTDICLGAQLSHEEQEAVKIIVQRHAGLFSSSPEDIGLYEGIEHKIKLMPDAKPYGRQPYRYTASDRQFLERQTASLLEYDIIRPSSGPWGFPAIVVTQKDKKRLCVNYIPLNQMTVNVLQPLPRADDIFDDLGGSSLFAVLDLCCAYWQIRVKDEDQEKTTFITHQGTFKWTRMPFGLKNAPSTFQKTMHKIFSQLKPRQSKSGVRTYLDDIIIFADTFSEFLDLLEEALTLLQQAGFKVSLKKCKFAVPSVKFLGFVISEQGKQPDPSKIEALLRIPAPTTSKRLLSWLQTANFYRRFICDFSKIAAPLQAAIRNVEFQWTPECQQAFETIRSALTSPPILGHFDADAPTTVATDASATALGAVLAQKQDGKETVIECASRLLTAPERKLHSNVWEAMAVHWAITMKFRHYLLGRRFHLLTDNWSVACLTSNFKPSRRFTGMLLDLAEFDFSVEHRPGRQNHVADMLSRYSCATVSQVDTLIAMQAEDETCKAIRAKLLSGQDTQNFVVVDKTLCRDVNPELCTIVVPAKMQQQVLELAHDANGHMDVSRTLTKVKDRYWWPKMTATTKEYVEGCQVCQAHNRPTTRSVGTMCFMPTREIPFSAIALDHITMPGTEEKYILNVIDFATRCIVPAAVPTTSTKDVLKHLHSLFYRFGACDDCLSDHAKSFESHQFRSFMRMHGVNMHFSVAYRAASNGLVERANGTLVTVLRKLCDGDQSLWVAKLEEAAFAVNTTRHRSTGFSPFELLFGFIPKLPRQKVRPHQASDLSERLLALPDLRSEAVSNSEQAQETRKTIYDRTHRDASYDIGDFVWIRRQEPILQGSEKLAPKFKGLYQVTRKRTPVTYDVRRVTNSTTTTAESRVAHVSQMKKYRPPYFDPILTESTTEDQAPAHNSVGLEAEPDLVPLPQSEDPDHHPNQRPQRHRTKPKRLQDYDLSLQD